MLREKNSIDKQSVKGKKMATKKKQLKLILMKSKYGRAKGHLLCVQGLGLRKIGQSVVVEDTPSIRGMMNKVSYLLKIEELK